MDIKKYKLALLFLALLAGIFVLLIYSAKALPSSNLEVFFLDIGQGDAILIKTPTGKKILIDGGPNSSLLTQLSKHISFFDRHIDMVILSHPHADHFTGLIPLIEQYNIESFLITGVLSENKTYMEFLKKIAQKPIFIAQDSHDLQIDQNVKIDIVFPDQSFENVFQADEDNLNNNSIVFRLLYGKTTFLFTGDMERPVEDAVLKAGDIIKATVLKAAHHGSNTSSAEIFIDRVSPKYVVMQVGRNNKFRHPHPEVLERYKKRGIQIFRNDLMKTILFSCNMQEQCLISTNL